MVDKWEFDVPCGIWMNAGLSYNVLHSAENLAGQRTVEFKVIPNVTAWIKKPHLRRSDASRIVCSCGATYEMPTDFGRVALHNDHLAANPSHTSTIERTPGKSMCFYGIGLGAVVATKTFPEGAEFPVMPSCNKPTIHASDCECATL